MLTRRRRADGLIVAKMRITGTRPHHEQRVHPGCDWFTVLSGTIRLHLGERVIQVAAGQAAQFSTMSPHALRRPDGPLRS